MLTNHRGNNLQHHELRPLLGRNVGKLGPEASGPHWVQGIQVKVLPANRWHRREHRVIAECPKCKRWFSAGGRLQQHARACI